MTEDSASDQGVTSMIDALLNRQGTVWVERLRSLGDETGYRAMIGAATVAVYRRWPADPSDAEITEYAGALGERSAAAGPPVSSAAIEALILTAFGREGQIRGLSVTELMPASAYLIHSVQDEGFLPDSDREKYLADVVEAAT